MNEFQGDAHSVWMRHYAGTKGSLNSIIKASNIGEARRGFKQLSDQMILLAVSFEPLERKLFIQHCPMANDKKGADWISEDEEIRNPYFGASMIGCGEIMRSIK
jgi:Cu(I)/Ag(I) efflux system membrane fusion protein